MILEIKNLKKVYETQNVRTEALSNVSFSVEKGEFVAIMGESGSGKTTLLNIIATLDKPTSGQVKINDVEVYKLKDNKIAKFRRNELGFVFQDFNLLDSLSNKDNILLPLVLSEISYKKMVEKLEPIVTELEISKLLEKFPYEISGGQKQRIAIARAIITEPSILLADEPTGALDSRSSSMVMNIMEDINKKGQTILMVTHSVKSAASANRVLFIKDGVIYHEIYKGSMKNEEFMEKISNSLLILERKGV